MMKTAPVRIKTISEFHKLRGLPPPEHPLISVADYSKVKSSYIDNAPGLLFDFYLISIKRGMEGEMRYGQQSYDFDEGVMFFMSPNQVLKLEKEQRERAKRTGWMLLIHPDFLWRTSLAKTIKQYEYFDYSVNEALFLSDSKVIMRNIIIFAGLFLSSPYCLAQNKGEKYILVLSVDLHTTTSFRVVCDNFATAFKSFMSINQISHSDSLARFSSFVRKAKYAKNNREIDSRCKFVYEVDDHTITICTDGRNILLNGRLTKRNKKFISFLNSMVSQRGDDETIIIRRPTSMITLPIPDFRFIFFWIKHQVT